MMDKDRSVIGSVEITPSQILVTTDGCTWTEEGEYDLKGRWRLVKLFDNDNDMICIFLEDVMVFEEHLEDPRCMAGDVVRYLIFDQEDILYRRTKKGQFSFSSNVKLWTSDQHITDSGLRKTPRRKVSF